MPPLSYMKSSSVFWTVSTVPLKRLVPRSLIFQKFPGYSRVLILLDQGLSTAALLTFWAGSPVLCRIFSGISDLCPLDVSITPLVTTTKKCLQTAACSVGWGAGQNRPQLRTPVLDKPSIILSVLLLSNSH